MTATSPQDVVVIDYETEKITGRPHYPPRPVGVSIWYPDKDTTPRYYAWGHPSGNSCSPDAGCMAVNNAIFSNRKMLFHNAKFDLAVMEKHVGVKITDWSRVHDTLFLLFLHDPHAPSLSLKPSAHRLLDIPPEEQAAVRDWLIENKVVSKSDKNWGAQISKAPGDLVGRYANGDTYRTWELFEYLLPLVLEADMGPAYDRERQLLPRLLQAENWGIRVDDKGLARAANQYDNALWQLDDVLRKTIKVDDDFNFAKREELATVLTERKLVTPLPRTPTGKFKTSGESFHNHIIDPELRRLFAYRAPLNTCVNTFLKPWNQMATANNGRLHPSWNQVRGEEFGTRTGRISSSEPNFTNVPNEFTVEIPPGFPPLPNLRSYILPEEGCVWVKADYNSQEIRMMAHFAEGALMEMYAANPRADAHTVATALIKERTGREVTRKDTKIIAFSLIYGAGLSLIANRLGISTEEAGVLKNAYLDSVPGVRELQATVTSMAKKGGVTSWGGRKLTAPFAKGGHSSGDRRWYALMNYLIQGSSADFTKQSLVDFFEATSGSPVTFLTTVYDENNISVPTALVKDGIKLLRKCMEEQALDVPMIAEFSIGENWGELIKL